MTSDGRFVSVGTVGRPHGRDGSFYVAGASHPLTPGTPVTIAGVARPVERRAGTDARPLVRLEGIEGRERVAELQGEPLLVPVEHAPLGEDEWLVEDLLACEVRGVGKVGRVLAAPSCDVLEVGPDGVLIPFISDAVKHVDVAAGRIDVDRRFLGLAAAEEAP